MWEGLLRFTFRRLQDNIDFGSVWGWILEGFGLHFGKVLGAKTEKKAFKRLLKTKRKKSNKKEDENSVKPRGDGLWDRQDLGKLEEGGT